MTKMRGWPHRRALVSAACVVSAAAAPARALDAQAVVLQIKPSLGDTLHMRLDQQTELTGTRRVGNGESVTSIQTTMRVFSRAVVEGSSKEGTLLRAITDSVRLSTTDEHARPMSEQTQRQLHGRSMRLRVAPDGTASVADERGGMPREMSEVVSLMPAAFPRAAVNVGDSWMREMPLPGASRLTPGGAPASGWLRAKFRLDSVARDGMIAYVSVRGDMDGETDSRNDSTTGPVLEKGTVTGNMIVDRRRGWVSESRFVILVYSSVALPGAAAVPMRFQTKITQRMRTLERR
jgi:hypothetical protein